MKINYWNEVWMVNFEVKAPWLQNQSRELKISCENIVPRGDFEIDPSRFDIKGWNQNHEYGFEIAMQFWNLEFEFKIKWTWLTWVSYSTHFWNMPMESNHVSGWNITVSDE
jgi:hypothetical protein